MEARDSSVATVGEVGVGDFAGPASPPRRRRRAGDRTLGLAYISPTLVLMGVWIYLPLGATIVLSFFRHSLTGGTSEFVGLANYAEIFTQPDFRRAAWNTLLYVIGLVPLTVLAPMGLAILLWKHPNRLTGFYRAVVFLPIVMAPVAVGIIWRWLLDPNAGLVNGVFEAVGLPRVDWLGSPSTALWAIVFITAWKVFSISFILITSGLTVIDSATVETARLDGAREWDVTTRVILPQLTPTLVAVTLLSVIFAGQWSFAMVNLLTQGGPVGATDNVFYYLYRYGFRFFNTGLASATAVIVLVVFGVLSYLQFRVGERVAGHEG